MELLVLAAAADAAWHANRGCASAWTGAGPHASTGPARTAGATEREGTRTGSAASRTTGRATPARTARTSLPARPAARLLVHVDERPLVVVVPSLIEPDRLLLALAHDADHAAGHGGRSEGAGASGRAHSRRSGAESAKSGSDASGGRAASTWSGRAGAAATQCLAALPGDRAAHGDRIEVLARHRVLELLPEVTSLHQHVDTGRKGLSPALEESNGADVLLTAEHELLFLLPLRVMTPHREGDRHHDRHHGERDEERRHRVTARVAEGPVRRSGLTP